MGTPTTLEVDLVIGADGANSRVAKDIDAGEYDYAIAFQVRADVMVALPARLNGVAKGQGPASSPGPSATNGCKCAAHRRAAQRLVNGMHWHWTDRVLNSHMPFVYVHCAGAHPHPRGQDGVLQGPGGDVRPLNWLGLIRSSIALAVVVC